MKNIKAIQEQVLVQMEYKKEVDTLLSKISESTQEAKEDAERETKEIKLHIAKDLEQFRNYCDDSIWKTRNFSVKVQSADANEEKYFQIVLAGNSDYINGDKTYHNVAIFYNYQMIYTDNCWVDENENVDERLKKAIQFLCENWDTALHRAYETLLLAYENDAKERLEEAMKKQRKILEEKVTLQQVQKNMSLFHSHQEEK